MTADAAIHAGTQVGAAVAAALAARELTEARVREIVREELAAERAARQRTSAARLDAEYARAVATLDRLRDELRADAEKLGHDREQSVDVDARSPVKSLNAVVDGDDADGHRRRKFHDQLTDFVWANLTILTLGDRPDTREHVEGQLAGGHGVGDLVEPRAEHDSDIIRGGHETSPSLVADTRSVGESPRPDAQPASGAGHQDGGSAS